MFRGGSVIACLRMTTDECIRVVRMLLHSCVGGFGTSKLRVKHLSVLNFIILPIVLSFGKCTCQGHVVGSGRLCQF